MRDDESFGWIAGILIIGGLWWFFSNYEIAKKPAPEVAGSKLASNGLPTANQRPTGLVLISVTTEGTKLSVDADSVSGPRTARLGWVVSDHTNDKKVTARTTKELQLVDCETGGLKVLSLVQYSADGELIFQESFDRDKLTVQYYPPGTIGASFQKEVCKLPYDAVKK